MIKTKEQYDIVCRQLQRVQSAFESLRREVEPKNKRNFEILTEGYAEQIAELARELDSYRTEHPIQTETSVGADQSHPICNENIEVQAAGGK
jgi:hypothetical protein